MSANIELEYVIDNHTYSDTDQEILKNNEIFFYHTCFNKVDIHTCVLDAIIDEEELFETIYKQIMSHKIHNYSKG